MGTKVEPEKKVSSLITEPSSYYEAEKYLLYYTY